MPKPTTVTATTAVPKLIERVAALARAAGRTIASPEEARLLLGISRRP
jgi:uncharacterized protein (DUF849 family)